MRIFHRRPVGVALVAGFMCMSAMSGFAQDSATLSYPDLLDRLVNLDHLAVLPVKGETAGQFSSYDRGGGNHDMGGGIRNDPEGLVFAEMDGPGCVWRIFSARPQKGHLKIYLDGATTPAVDMPFKDYFEGTNAPFTRSELVQKVARGFINYTPIPYQKSCKIVADGKWGIYYTINYSTFPPGTKVPTFTRELSPEDSAALDRVNERLKRCGPQAEGLVGRATGPSHIQTNTQTWNVSLSDERSETKVLSGPAAIRTLRLVMPDLPGYPDDRRILREWTISIRWDDEKEPAVWAPLGDFFGTAAGANIYRSLPMGYTEDGVWYSNWTMPFAKRAEITLCNEGRDRRKVEVEIVTSPLAGEVAQYGRFHAKWHRDTPSTNRPGWQFVNTQGRGRFVGVMLHVKHSGMWWGEGDEMFWVDGEKKQSFQGTGSEDFFGYAWASPMLFYNAFHNQPLSEGNQGNASVNRWFIGDNVPFQTAFDAAIEKCNGPATLYSCTAYWYLEPETIGKADPYGVVPLADRLYHWSTNLPVRVPGAVEVGYGDHLEKNDGKLVGHRSGSGSNGDTVQWKGLQTGDRLTIPIWAYKPGKYAVGVKLGRSPHNATCKLYLDGKQLGEPVDCYDEKGADMGEIDLGTHEMTQGRHAFTFEVCGANPKTRRVNKEWYLDMDYVKFLLKE